MIDTHAHLNDTKLFSRVDDILSDDYLEYVIVPGYHERSSRIAVDIASQYKKAYATVGCHPHDADKFSDLEYKYYESVANHPKVVAIGEIGLDYYRDLTPRDVQKRVFEEQILLADSVGLPIVLHVRDAYADTLEILERNRDKLKNGVLLHCYSGSRDTVREFLRYDCYFALGGAVTYKGAKKEDVIRAIPLDRLVLETDAPYLTPVPKRGEINEPKYVAYTLRHVGGVLGISDEKLQEITTQNAKRFFNLEKI